MQINPEDISIYSTPVYGTWGILVEHRVIITHKPTNTRMIATDKLAHHARAKAFNDLQVLLDSAPQQLTLF